MVYQVPGSIETAINDAIQNLRELSAGFVKDSVGNVYWMEMIIDESDGTTTYTYYDQPGGIAQIPVGDVEPIIGPSSTDQIQIISRCDDVNSDGTDLVTFYRVNVYDDAGAIVSSIPSTASGAPYTVLGTEVDCKEGETREVTSTDLLVTVNTTIPAGFIHGSFGVIKGDCTINGITYDKGDILNLPPMSYGNQQLLYPDYDIVPSASSEIRVNYHE